tara:strand:- start:76760 stop:77116 length:357 start_codon:yes stop_codon:yes gene_type:complete
MSYNTTSFANDPDKANRPGILYIIVLVNKKTYERECVKIGITKGKSFKDAVKRSAGFKGYDIRIQKLIKGTLEEVYDLEQVLHEEYKEYSFKPTQKFGGHTECFHISILSSVLARVKE